MEITNEQIESAFKIGGAAVSGGVIWKILDVLSGRRKQRADSDATNVDSAMKLVKALNEDLEMQKEENRVHREQYEAIRIEVTDLKIIIRSLYAHMSEHMRTCKEPLNLPTIPESLKDN